MLPLIVTDEELVNEELEAPTSRTYKFDFERGEILAQFVDNEDAIRQAAVKIVKTIRDKYLIYSSDYGSEMSDLIGQMFSLEYLQIEVPRLITEALVVDDRIEDCTNFEVAKEGDSIVVSFEIVTEIETSIVVEVEI